MSIKALSDETFPKLKDCHLSLRANAFLGSDGGSVERGLNLEEGTSEDFVTALSQITDRLLPLSLEFLDLEGIRRHYRQDAFKRALVFWQAREILEAQ